MKDKNTDSNPRCFGGWDRLTLEDLLRAYRKAKSDCFYGNLIPTTIEFSTYETDLLGNLQRLLDALKSNSGFENQTEFLGTPKILPKKTSVTRDRNSTQHAYFSDTSRAIENTFKTSIVKPEFRIVGDFPVNTHIISALWINLIGHKIDAKLSPNCYANRLKRIRIDPEHTIRPNTLYHIDATGSFIPYFHQYQKWRNDGLNAMRTELGQDNAIIAISLDLKSYYHSIDPKTLHKPNIVEDIKLNEEEQTFNNQLTRFLSKWSQQASLLLKKTNSNVSCETGGIPIGITCSGIIANAILHSWDRLVIENINPLYYGRYVDDMTIVLRDPGNIPSFGALMKTFKKQLGRVIAKPRGKRPNHVYTIDLEVCKGTKTVLEFQSKKTKFFALHGRSGLELLESIERNIGALASERRLMPLPEELEKSTAAKVLKTITPAEECASSLGKIDGITLRRLGWSLQFRHMETLGHDLQRDDWTPQRNEFYRLANAHILRPESIFSYLTFIPRLLGFAIRMKDWKQASETIRLVYKASNRLKQKLEQNDKGKCVVNGKEVDSTELLWAQTNATLVRLLGDSLLRNLEPGWLPQGQESGKGKTITSALLKHHTSSENEPPIVDILKLSLKDLDSKLREIQKSDLSFNPYKQIITNNNSDPHLFKKPTWESDITALIEEFGINDMKTLRAFLSSARSSRKMPSHFPEEIDSVTKIPFLFPTRPLSPAEISELAPECVGSPAKIETGNGTLNQSPPRSGLNATETWNKYVKAIRGSYMNPEATNKHHQPTVLPTDDHPMHLIIGNKKANTTTIAISSLLTKESDWEASAVNHPNHTRTRYQKLSIVVNDAIRMVPKPDYLVLPELSVPLRWVPSISQRLSASGISLIAGTEYRHCNDDEIVSEAVLALVDDRLGYATSVIIWQEKQRPAPDEERLLLTKFGKKWRISEAEAEKSRKPVYVHNNFHFGILICSELQDCRARTRFQGQVDALFTLSWNRDLNTFASLLESSCLDIHCYSVLVNNRRYGDSRVRSPAKEPYDRDLARIKGGENNFVITATLNFSSLRDFQSRAMRWPDSQDHFKPVPEGYKISNNRRSRIPK